MPTSNELGLYKGVKPSRELLKEIAFEPTVDSINNYGQNFQKLGRDSLLVPDDHGKFIAYGTAFIFAPFADNMRHSYMVDAAADVLGEERIATEIEAARRDGVPQLPRQFGVATSRNELLPTDAGDFMVFYKNEGVVDEVSLAAKSTDFERAKQDVRERMAELLRAALHGIAIHVSKH